MASFACLADLNIYPCRDKAYNIDEALLGSIKQISFKQWWQSNKESFFKVDPSRVCNHHCVAHEHNKMILELGVIMNELEYYRKHNLATIRQDISDMELHLKRRERLYELVGIPKKVFKRANVLEVGAGGGYNALALLSFGANVDIVEPNARACEDARELFEKCGIPKHQYRIYDCLIEDYQFDRLYDFISAEGFLPTLESKEVKEKVVQSLKKMLLPSGNVLVTSMCEIGYAFEDFRRALGMCLIDRVKDLEEQIEILTLAFSTHLSACKFATKPIRDWVVATILNPGLDSNFSSLADVVKMFCEGRDCEVVGMSPNLIPNLSWYRNIEYSYADVICKEFLKKEHLLLSNDLTDHVRSEDKNLKLTHNLREFREIIKNIKKGVISSTGGGANLLFIEILEKIARENADIGGRFMKAIVEIIKVLKGEVRAEVVANMDFKNAWGQGQQYINFKKY